MVRAVVFCLLAVCAAAQQSDPEFEASEKAAAAAAAAAATAAGDAGSGGGSAKAATARAEDGKVVEYNSASFELVANSPTRTLCILALGEDGTPEQKATNRALLAAYAAQAQRMGARALHTVVLPAEKSIANRYFAEVAFRPAIYMVDRGTGAFARPFEAFKAAEAADWGATLVEFEEGFFEAAKAAATPSKLLALTDATFNATIAEHRLLFVEFYAPWCTHCKAAAPELEKAAETLERANPPQRLAKVDATANPALKARFGVDSFPTFVLFRKGAAVRDALFSEKAVAATVVKFVTRQAAAPVVAPTEAALLALEKQHAEGVLVVAFLAGGVGGAALARQNVLADAAAGSSHVYVRAAAAESALRHGVKQPGLVVIGGGKPTVVPFAWPGGGAGSAPADATAQQLAWKLGEAVEETIWPLVAKFTRDPAQQRAVQLHPVKDMMLVVLDKDDFSFDLTYEAIREVAAEHKGRMLFFWVDARDEFLLRKLRVVALDVPAVLAFSPMRRAPMDRMDADAELTAESLREFVGGYFEKHGGEKKKKKDEL